MIEQVVLAILKFLEHLLRRDTTSEDAKRDPGLRDMLRDRILRHEQRLRDKSGAGPER